MDVEEQVPESSEGVEEDAVGDDNNNDYEEANDGQLMGRMTNTTSMESQEFQDHFSLPSSSSTTKTVRFRKTNTLHRVYPNTDSQFVIREAYGEEQRQRVVSTMEVSDSTPSLKLLRSTCTLVCAFFVSTGPNEDTALFLIIHALIFIEWLVGSTGGLGLFKRVTPVRQYTYDDALGARPFITANTWLLEKLFCRPHNS